MGERHPADRVPVQQVDHAPVGEVPDREGCDVAQGHPDVERRHQQLGELGQQGQPAVRDLGLLPGVLFGDLGGAPVGDVDAHPDQLHRLAVRGPP